MRPILLVAILCAGLADPAVAQQNSTTPSCISLVGTHAAVPDAGTGQFTVIFRDLANNPIAGANVVIDLSGCPDMHLCADQMDPGATVDCAHETVTKITAADGSVQFTLLGGSNGSGNATSLLNRGKIYAGGFLIQNPTVSAYDLDGSGGVGANDLSAWLLDFSTGQQFGRCDYDCSGYVGANDLSLWLIVFGSGTMSESCGASCP